MRKLLEYSLSLLLAVILLGLWGVDRGRRRKFPLILPRPTPSGRSIENWSHFWPQRWARRC